MCHHGMLLMLTTQTALNMGIMIKRCECGKSRLICAKKPFKRNYDSNERNL